jgi:hypothetical protein
LARRTNRAGGGMIISGRVADGRLATLHGPARSCFGDKTRPVGAGSQPGRSRALNSDQHRSDCCGGTDNKWSRSDQHQMASIGEIRVQVPSGSRATAVETGHGQRAAVSGQQSSGTCTSTVGFAMAWFFPFLVFHLSSPPLFTCQYLLTMEHPPCYHRDDTILFPFPTPHPRNTADGMCEAGCSVDAVSSVCLMRGRIGRARCPMAGKGICSGGTSLVAAVSRFRQCSDQTLSIFQCSFVVETCRGFRRRV